jgi:benzoate transport
MSKSVSQMIDDRPMKRFQWGVIALCFLINMLDGFDVLVMAFTAASVSAHWSLSGTQLGYLLSAGLVGMAIGSLFIAPWADRFGRRPLILFCIALAGTGMILSAYASSAVHLGLMRFVTGLGIGGILASSYVIAGEYASKRWRGLAISLQSTAYALGATIGGIIAAKIIPTLGWQSIFFYGGITTLATLPIMFVCLPESLDFLLGRQPSGALRRINTLLAKVGLASIDVLPPLADRTRVTVRASFTGLFAPKLLLSTLLIWLSFFLVMFGFYFVLSWTPRLLVSAGLSNQQGITGGVLLNVGGIVGTSLIGLLAARFRMARVLTIYLLANAVLMSIFVGLLADLNVAFCVAFLIGIFVNGCVAGLYALTPSIYDSTQRVTGLGWAIGIGRMGAILSPLVAGKLIDASWQPAQLFTLFGSAFILAAVTVLLLQASRPKTPIQLSFPKRAEA